MQNNLKSNFSLTLPYGKSWGKHVKQKHCSSFPVSAQPYSHHFKCCALKQSATHFLPAKLHFRACCPKNLTFDTLSLRIKSQTLYNHDWFLSFFYNLVSSPCHSFFNHTVCPSLHSETFSPYLDLLLLVPRILVYYLKDGLFTALWYHFWHTSHSPRYSDDSIFYN